MHLLYSNVKYINTMMIDNVNEKIKKKRNTKLQINDNTVYLFFDNFKINILWLIFFIF